MKTEIQRFVWGVMAVFLLVGTQSLFSARRKSAPCTLHAKTVMSDSRHFTLVVEYPRHCEVAMDGDDKKIVLTIAKAGGSIGKTIPKKKKTLNRTRASSATVEALIEHAKSKVGSSYVYGATGPDHFDCSGFVYYLYKSEGIVIPRTSKAQSESGNPLSRDQLRKGDMVFFDTFNRGHVNHSGLYLGGGRFIHASSGKVYGVTISNLDRGFYKEKFRWGVRRIEAKEEQKKATPPPKTAATVPVPSKKAAPAKASKPKATPRKKVRKRRHKRKKTHTSHPKHTRKMTLSEGISHLFENVKK